MKILEEPPDVPPSHARLVATIVVLLVIATLGGAWLWLRPGASPPGPATPTRVAPAPLPVTAAAPPATTPTEPSVAKRRGAPKAKTAPPPATEPAKPALQLKVDSDVAGASVFVDRVYAGKTPLTTTEVTPGSHVVTVSAEGYDSQASTIEVAGGTNEVMARFKVVRLNESIAVVHKHTIGSCEGRLVADARGLRYETTNQDHAFSVQFADLKAFEVDYLKKNLRVTRKDGKTFNFTDRTANADALFVFHKKVDAARQKLAAGVPPGEK